MNLYIDTDYTPVHLVAIELDVREADRIAEEFAMLADWARCPIDAVANDFVNRLHALLKEFHDAQSNAASQASPAQDRARPAGPVDDSW